MALPNVDKLVTNPRFARAVMRTIGQFWLYAFLAALIAVVLGEVVGFTLQRVLPREATAWTTTAVIGLVAAVSYESLAARIRGRSRR